MSADFELFDKLFSRSIKCNENESIPSVCIHQNKTEMSGAILCTDCGEEIEKNITHDKEWRYYGQSDTKHVSDPNRCQVRKVDDKNIFKDVENLGFSDKIITLANKIYLQVTGGKIHRGNSRKAIIFACIFHAYKMNGKPQTCETLIEVFNLDRKTGLRGLKYVNLNIPKESIINTSHITPANLIEEIMNKFGASDEQKGEVIQLYEKIKNKSSKINRSRPQSIAAGLTYYWICENNKRINIKEFTEKVKLSELTITRIAKEISSICKSE
jgi:transcription initiation factor TFIIIB Brf1 subunit/transcription initiation factor TFIIB